jgi:hypothetical protein
MGYWHFKSYEGEDGNQPWAWLSQHGEDVREYIYSQLYAASQIEDAPPEECIHLPGKYVGLSQFSIPFDEPFQIWHVALIGFWEPDSTNFIVTVCCEVDDHTYGLWLERAWQHKLDWEQHLGDVYDLFPGEDSI